MKQDKERQNLLARINELEQTLNNEHAVGRQKMLEEILDRLVNEAQERFLIGSEIPREEVLAWINSRRVHWDWQPQGNDMSMTPKELLRKWDGDDEGIKGISERQQMLDELARDAFNHFKRAEILNEMRIKDYIEQWKPRGE